MSKSAGSVISSLSDLSTEDRKTKNEYFFKTGKGQYSEGDIFMGVSMPHIRQVAQNFQSLDFSELAILLHHEVHEVRMCALIILVLQYKSAANDEKKKTIVDFYLCHKSRINNWDLVDCSAHYILGQAILEGLTDKSVLDDLVTSSVLWDRRIAMVSTWIMIRSGQLDTTFDLAEKLLGDREDLMHKAVGWMLREAWKKDAPRVESFLMTHYSKLPRTTLRYAIERMELSKRQKFLKGHF